jgi:predicted ester cyclase
MSKKERIAAVKTFEDAWVRGDTSVIPDLTTNDFVFHGTGAGVDLDRNAIAQSFLRWKAGFPDLSQTIEDTVAEGDKVAIRTILAGTQKDTGKKIRYPRFAIYVVKNNKITEAWNLDDRLTFLQQLGAIPFLPAKSQ